MNLWAAVEAGNFQTHRAVELSRRPVVLLLTESLSRFITLEADNTTVLSTKIKITANV